MKRLTRYGLDYDCKKLWYFYDPTAGAVLDTNGLDDSGEEYLLRDGRIVVKINDLCRRPNEAAANGVGRIQSEILRLSGILGDLWNLMRSETAGMQKDAKCRLCDDEKTLDEGRGEIAPCPTCCSPQYAEFHALNGKNARGRNRRKNRI